MSEYHQDLNCILQWSTGRMAVIWKTYSARQKTIAEAFRSSNSSTGHSNSDGSRFNSGSTSDRSANRVVEREARDLRDLSRVLKVKAEPYPGTTPFNKEVPDGH